MHQPASCCELIFIQIILGNSIQFWNWLSKWWLFPCWLPKFVMCITKEDCAAVTSNLMSCVNLKDIQYWKSYTELHNKNVVLLFLILAPSHFTYFLTYGTLFRTEFCLNSYCHESQLIDWLSSWSIVLIFFNFSFNMNLSAQNSLTGFSVCAHVCIDRNFFIHFIPQQEFFFKPDREKEGFEGWLVGWFR